MAKFILVACAAMTVSVRAFGIEIDFDDGPGPEQEIGSFYSGLGVTLSNAIWADNFHLAGSSGSLAVISQRDHWYPQVPFPIVATFGIPVSTLSLRGIDVGVNGFELKAYDPSNALISDQTVFGSGDGDGQFFDLTALGNIHKIEFSEANHDSPTDAMLWDNLRLNEPVPEPVTVIGLGAGLLALCRRRRQTK